MSTRQARNETRRSGAVTVLALILLVMFASLGAAYATASNAQLIQSSNCAHIQTARLQAESGLSFCSNVLGGISLPGSANGQEMLDSLAVALSARLDGSGNLAGGVVAYDGSTITIPAIVTDDRGRSFSAALYLAGDDVVHLIVVGMDGAVSRQMGMNMALVPGSSGVFDYAIASRSKIYMTGNAKVRGLNDTSEANILTTTYADPEAVKMVGNCEIEGDAFISNPAAHATLTGNVKIGGESSGSGDILDHIHIGIGDMEFPEVDPTVFEPFAVNVVDSGTSTSGNKTFTNIRILAGANKTFSGNIKLNGVTFVEAPNTVHFSGNVTITGVVVTADAGEGVYETNTIKFTGNTTVRGVEQLPDDPEFSELREMPGSFLLAPGFGVQFTGNFGTVSGAMAADNFKWTGNAGGTVHGCIINYGDSQFKLSGNSNLTFDRSDDPVTPPGFTAPGRLVPVPSSYTEY